MMSSLVHTRRFIFISRCALEERTVIESYKNLNGNGRGIKYEEVEREGKKRIEERNMQVEERERKKRIEEIGKEDAWFKTYRDQPQISVGPGGRWSQFKTYSTIQNM